MTREKVPSNKYEQSSRTALSSGDSRGGRSSDRTGLLYSWRRSTSSQSAQFVPLDDNEDEDDDQYTSSEYPQKGSTTQEGTSDKDTYRPERRRQEQGLRGISRWHRKTRFKMRWPPASDNSKSDVEMAQRAEQHTASDSSSVKSGFAELSSRGGGNTNRPAALDMFARFGSQTSWKSTDSDAYLEYAPFGIDPIEVLNNTSSKKRKKRRQCLIAASTLGLLVAGASIFFVLHFLYGNNNASSNNAPEKQQGKGNDKNPEAPSTSITETPLAPSSSPTKNMDGLISGGAGNVSRGSPTMSPTLELSFGILPPIDTPPSVPNSAATPSTAPGAVPTRSPAPTEVPSTLPKTAPPTLWKEIWQGQFQDLLLSQEVLSAERVQLLEDPNSIQTQAWEWLWSHDSYTSLHNETKLQRYALAVLYASLNGGAWSNSFSWMDPQKSECTWAGVFCQPSSLPPFQPVTAIILVENGLQGALPEELVLLRHTLDHVSLFGNQIESGDWSFVSELTQLKFLDLANNEINGTIPESLGRLRRLQELYLSNNRMGGRLPPYIWSNFTNLTKLEAHNNGLTGLVPLDLPTSKLQTLSLAHNLLNGTLPTTLGRLTRARELRLNDNHFNGLVPKQVGNLKELLTLELDRNRLSGMIPTEIGLLSNIQHLTLNENDLRGRIPSTIGNLKQCATLGIYFNLLSGKLPPEMGNMTSLVKLDLEENFLQEEIPASFGNLQNLVDLRLEVNLLSGTIPSELSQLKSLVGLKLNDNSLTGRLPTAFGTLSSLVILHLNMNILMGTIPPEWGNMTSLQSLFLDDNQLTGNIPPSLGNLNLMDELYLNGNFLGGTVPLEICDLVNVEKTLGSLVTDCGGNPPRVRCTCCTSCRASGFLGTRQLKLSNGGGYDERR